MAVTVTVASACLQDDGWMDISSKRRSILAVFVLFHFICFTEKLNIKVKIKSEDRRESLRQPMSLSLFGMIQSELEILVLN